MLERHSVLTLGQRNHFVGRAFCHRSYTSNEGRSDGPLQVFFSKTRQDNLRVTAHFVLFILSVKLLLENN